MTSNPMSRPLLSRAQCRCKIGIGNGHESLAGEDHKPTAEVAGTFESGANECVATVGVADARPAMCNRPEAARPVRAGASATASGAGRGRIGRHRRAKQTPKPKGSAGDEVKVRAASSRPRDVETYWFSTAGPVSVRRDKPLGQNTEAGEKVKVAPLARREGQGHKMHSSGGVRPFDWRQFLFPLAQRHLRFDRQPIGTRYAVVSAVALARRFLACSAR